MKMTNVDFEGFNDWTTEELIEAKNAIDRILIERNAKVDMVKVFRDIEKALGLYYFP